jgi:uncharacterized protein
MEFIPICITAFLASGLTLFSGFGLGTLLMPVFAIFFPLDLAIALTAVVHFLNNLFKLALMGRYANRKVVIRFGILSVLFAFAGALCLQALANLKPVASYSFAEHEHQISLLNLSIAFLLLLFSLFDLVPRLSRMSFEPAYLPLGGALSGFIGGLSGHQGALRTAFLMKADLSKESFIGTGVLIACMTDISRLTVYSRQIITSFGEIDMFLMIAATLAAFAGAYLGSKLLKKVTIRALHLAVGIMLIVFSLALGSGLI